LCIKKIKRWKHYLPLKSSGLVTLFFLAYYFLLRKKPFQVTVGFVGRFDHFRHSAFIGFHEDRLGGTQSRNNRLVANSVGIPLKTSLRWIGFDCVGIVYAWE
jgi:hypothetical protein